MPTPNPTTRRQYAGAAAQTNLASGISAADTTFVLNANTNWPTGSVGNFIVTIDRGQANEERILCASQAGKIVTVAGGGRGFDGTSAMSHLAGATVECTLSAFDADEWNQHTNATSGVHGVAGNVVGDTDTQTLTNKTLTTPTIAAVKTNGGAATVTLPASTDTLVGRATTDTLTNKTIDTAGPNTVKVGGVDISTAWATYTPTLPAGWTATINDARYKQVGKTVTVIVWVTFTAVSTGTLTLSLPVAANTTNNQCVIGSVLGNTGANLRVGVVVQNSGTLAGLQDVAGTWSQTVPATWAINDLIRIQATYEAA